MCEPGFCIFDQISDTFCVLSLLLQMGLWLIESHHCPCLLVLDPMGPNNHVILQTILTPCFSLFPLLLSLHSISTNPTATRESTGNILISSCHFHRKCVAWPTDRNFLTSLIYSANHPEVLKLLHLAMIDLSEILPWYQIIYWLASMFENSCAA